MYKWKKRIYGAPHCNVSNFGRLIQCFYERTHLESLCFGLYMVAGILLYYSDSVEELQKFIIMISSAVRKIK